ncbi:MAG: hypothetical protein IJ757_07650 [Clostridiales bacterium]|nr:hypothetical protein [Clostridiales bacterium]
MKKLVSTMIAFALVFALAIPAFAASSPSSSSGSDVVTSATSSVQGQNVGINAANPTDAQLAAAQAAAAEIAGDTAYTLDYADVEVYDANGNVVSADYFANNSALLVTFVRNDASEVLAVLYWNEATQSFDSAAFTQDGNIVNATFTHLCLITFVVKDASATAAAADDAATTATAAEGTSAQTGYTAIVWAVVAIVAVAGAAICFKTSKKSAVSAA